MSKNLSIFAKQKLKKFPQLPCICLFQKFPHLLQFETFETQEVFDTLESFERLVI